MDAGLAVAAAAKAWWHAFFVWLTVGLYDPPVRELMGYTLVAREEWLHRRFGDLVHSVITLLPKRGMMHPRARAGWDRATGPDPRRRTAGGDPGAQPAAGRAPRQRHALLPEV